MVYAAQRDFDSRFFRVALKIGGLKEVPELTERVRLLEVELNQLAILEA